MTINKGDEFYIKHEPAGGDNYWMSGPYVCTLAELGFIYHEYDEESGRRIEHCRHEENCVKRETNDEV